MMPASVGFHCPACAGAGPATVRGGRAAFAPTDPLATKILIGCNVAAFFVMVAASGRTGAALQGGGGSIVADFGLIGIGLDGRIGQLVGVAEGQWWRLVTGGFLHGGLLHLGFNMVVLWLLGSQLERALGRPRYLTLYVSSLLAGSLGVMLVDPTRMTVGASGAIFGLMGAAVALQRSGGVNWWQSGLGTLIVVNLLLTFTVPNISVGGHLGGLVGGLVAGGLMVLVDRRAASEWLAVGLGAVFGLACAVGAIWAADQWRDPVLGFLSF
jgi:membrane associated rhomboid family serine protease